MPTANNSLAKKEETPRVEPAKYQMVLVYAYGDSHFLLGDYNNAISALSNAVQCPNGLGNPFVHLRIGEAAFELGQLDKAKDELTRAYIGAGKEIFSTESSKYLNYLYSILQLTSGKDS